MKFTKLLLVLASFGALVVTFESAAQAGQTPDQTFQVTTNVVASCTLTLAPITFPDYDPMSGSDVTTTASWTVKCTKDAPLSIAIGIGQHQVDAQNNGMTLGGATTGDKLKYQLTNTSGTQWNNAVLSIANGSGTNQTVTINGKIPGNQNVTVGNGYQDQVIATVNY